MSKIFVTFRNSWKSPIYWYAYFFLRLHTFRDIRKCYFYGKISTKIRIEYLRKIHVWPKKTSGWEKGEGVKKKNIGFDINSYMKLTHLSKNVFRSLIVFERNGREGRRYKSVERGEKTRFSKKSVVGGQKVDGLKPLTVQKLPLISFVETMAQTSLPIAVTYLILTFRGHRARKKQSMKVVFLIVTRRATVTVLKISRKCSSPYVWYQHHTGNQSPTWGGW